VSHSLERWLITTRGKERNKERNPRKERKKENKLAYFYFTGFNVVEEVMKTMAVFWIVPPYSSEGVRRLLLWYSTLKVEATCSSSLQTKRRYNT
jgi:hypothetical protein